MFLEALQHKQIFKGRYNITHSFGHESKVCLCFAFFFSFFFSYLDGQTYLTSKIISAVMILHSSVLCQDIVVMTFNTKRIKQRTGHCSMKGRNRS